ncbi:MAG: Sodium Bile acid symporter family protein [Xanthobacteraceae bacterium]|nr:Sodium Bile acid symporter family protein [Xanthobacteraceae bacterium]
MNLLALPLAMLSWLGRQGTRAVAGAILLGMVLPPLAPLFRPLFTGSLFVLLCLAFLRVEPAALRGYFARPILMVAVVVWFMLAVPLLVGFALPALGLGPQLPALFLALMLQAIAPPLMSSPTLAALMGLDAALSLATLIACTLLAPLTAPLLTSLFIGAEMSVAPLALGLRLVTMLAGAALVAAAIRYWVGRDAITRQNPCIDGLSVVALFVFAVPVMEGVLATTVTAPLRIVGLIALTFAITFVLIALTALVFWPLGRRAAITLGLASGSRNMGLMLAAAGAGAPELVWLYIAVAQLPIYLLPLWVKPLAQRFIHRASD